MARTGKSRASQVQVLGYEHAIEALEAKTVTGFAPHSDQKKYSGFTCPVCGSHMFGTQSFPNGRKFGTCNERYHSGNDCTFTWDRDNKEDEANAVYQMTQEEWMAQFKNEAKAVLDLERDSPAYRLGYSNLMNTATETAWVEKHPIEGAIARMSPRDQRIADELAEAGFSDEDLYAALQNPGAERLLRGDPPPKKKLAAGVQPSDGGQHG